MTATAPAAEPVTRPNADHGGTIGIVGADGVVGDRFRRRLQAMRPGVEVVRLDTRTESVARMVGRRRPDVVALLQPDDHAIVAGDFASLGVAVISTGDRVADVRRLLASEPVAADGEVPIVVGAGMAPGLAALLARHVAAQLDTVDEIHVALHGTAGPACARRHHRALAGTAITWHDGVETMTRAGTGRELVWFPEPVGPYDCYRAEMPAPLVLRAAFPGIRRATVRVSANRRDRLTSRLPMLTPPHREGGVGAVRVEVRGTDRSGARRSIVAGVAELVATATAATVVAFTELVLSGRASPGLVVPGAADLDTTALLRSVERAGVRLQEFTGVPTT